MVSHRLALYRCRHELRRHRWSPWTAPPTLTAELAAGAADVTCLILQAETPTPIGSSQ